MAKRPWIPPLIRELPKLTALTLASAIGGGGGTGGGGSTVFGILLALFVLAGCVADPSGEPSAEVHALPQTISCRATVATGVIDCGGPQAISTPEIIGGQGTFVALRSTNVSYDGSAIFQADVKVQNLASQTLGGTGNGVDVFFESGPTVTSGTGTVTVNNPSGNATFTHSGQDYFHYSDSVRTGENSSTLTWMWNVPVSVTTFAFTVQVSTEVEDAGGVLLWSEVPEFASDSFTGIAVNSSTDVMAVGIHGATMRKVGSQWQRMPVQLAEDWVGVSAIGGGKYVGATLQGSVALFDGKVWKVISNRGYAIHGVTAYAANRIAVGGANKVEWYGDNGWYSIGVGGSTDFTYFVSTAVNQGFGVSIDGDKCAFNFNSSTPSCGGSTPVTAAYGWLGGGSGVADSSGGQGDIFDFGSSFLASNVNDTTFTALELGSGGPYLWAAAKSNTTGLSHLNSWTGGVWTQRAQVDHEVIRMVQDSAGGLYLLSADGIRRWNGSAIVDELVASTDLPTALGASGSDVWVGTDAGFAWRYQGGAWSRSEVDPAFHRKIRSITGTGGNTAWAADTASNLYAFDGTTWSVAATLPTLLNDMWLVDPTHGVIAGSAPPIGGIIWRNDGSGWVPQFYPAPTPGSNLNAIYGVSINDFWVVGNQGHVVHYVDPTYSDVAIGTAEDLLAVAGTSSSDVWVAGTNGYIAHWDGVSWTTCAIGGASITALYSPRPGVVYVGTGAVSDTLTAALCGARGVHVPGAIGKVTSMSGPSADDLWAIIGERIYWGHR